MTSCGPFVAHLYADPYGQDDGVLDLTDVIALPDSNEHDANTISDLSRYSVRRLLADADGAVAASWEAEGILTADYGGAIYACRTGYRSTDGEPQTSTGVFVYAGSPPERESASSLQIEPTTLVTEIDGLSELVNLPAMPLIRATDSHRRHHRIFRIDLPGVVQTVCEALDDVCINDLAGLVFVQIDSKATAVPLGLIMARV